MYRTFGDLFSYRTSGEFQYSGNTRWFHDCILLKDVGAEHSHAGSSVNTIQVKSSGRIWLSIDPNGMVYEQIGVTMIPPSYDQIITDIKSDIVGTDIVTLITFNIQRELEDYYGIVFGDVSYRKFITMTTYKLLSTMCSSRDKIVSAFRRSISDPSYAMCRNRLMREFTECVF